MLLHAVIAGLPVQTAYKEGKSHVLSSLYTPSLLSLLLSSPASFPSTVHKFKRRPQYLEYIVHLATAAMAQGKLEVVVEWSREVFAWLKRYGHGHLMNRTHTHTHTLCTCICSCRIAGGMS